LWDRFLKPLAPNNDMSNIPKDRVSRVTNDGNVIKVSTTILMTRENVCVLEPRGVDERLDPQHGEAQCKVCLP